MEDKELRKSKAKKRLWALSLALITCFSALLTAFSLFAPKTNLVLAEEVEATATQSSPESITINVTTLPTTAVKNFSVTLTNDVGSNPSDYITYEIASDYTSITVTCNRAFDGVAKIIIVNNYNSKASAICKFRYKADFVYENATLWFQRWEGTSNDRQFVDGEIFYTHGDGTDPLNGISNGEVGQSILYAGDDGFPLLKLKGNYKVLGIEHTYTRGDIKPIADNPVRLILNNDAFVSLSNYFEYQWGFVPISINKEYLSLFDANGNCYKTYFGSGDMQFFRCIAHDSDLLVTKEKSETDAYNLIYEWMANNPDVALFSFKHNDTYTSYVYNRYFEVQKVASSVETDLGEHIFNS